MKLQKILELTKLSKKAVYFYIKEGLIEPTKNISNRYYEFSEGDLRKLQIISSLRNIGMSIQDIKDLFVYPTLTNLFIHRQINNLKKSLYENINQLEASYQLIENIPTNATPKNLKFSLEMLGKKRMINDIFLEKYFPNKDSRMIAILLCVPFIDIESSEYHNFLWDKISNELELQLESNLSYLNYWKLVYDQILVPTLQFFQYRGSKLLGEYNPNYEKYNKNMYLIAKRVYKRLKEKRELLEGLNLALDNKFDPERGNYSELICIYTFRTSIYSSKAGGTKRVTP